MVFIFDMDGVLVDNLEFHIEAWAEFARRHNLPSGSDDVKKYFGMTNEKIFRLLTNGNITDEQIRELSEEKETIYREIFLPHIKPVKGLPEFLQKLKTAGCKTAVATAGPRSNVDFVLEQCHITGFFDAIVDDSHVRRSKPDPEVFLLAASQLNAAPADCVVFEDSHAGIQAAKTAGMRVVGVATTHPRNDLLALTPEVIQHFEKTEKVIIDLLASI